MRKLLVIAVGICLSTACDGAASRTSAPLTATDPGFVQAANNAGAVFEGDIVAVSPGPGVWSGRLAAYQSVIYRVVKVVTDPGKRLSMGTQVTVQHLLVAKSETADTQPRLRPALVAVGSTVIVLASWSDDQWTGVNEHYGIIAADAAHRAALAEK